MISLTFKSAELNAMTAEQLNAWSDLAKAVHRNIHPVVGLLTIDHNSEALGTNFLKFNNSTLEVDGLCQVEHKTIRILAIVSMREGRGMFTAFLRELMQHYETIEFLCVWNGDLRRKLLKVGFKRFWLEDSDKKKMECYRWQR